MASEREPERQGGLAPSRPLVGYRDTGEGVRHSRAATIRACVILALIAAFYLGWTLTVYFLEPGLR